MFLITEFWLIAAAWEIDKRSWKAGILAKAHI